jgi:transposase InsO family protein
MFALPSWPAGNRRATSVAALEAAVNAALGVGGGADAVLVMQSGADATAEINARREARGRQLAGAAGPDWRPGAARCAGAAVGSPMTCRIRMKGTLQARIMLALVIDCQTRELLGWHLSRSGKATTAASALEHALINRFGTLGKATREFLLRSDNGIRHRA